VRKLLIAAAAAIAMGGWISSPAQAAVLPAPHGHIFNNASPRCLDYGTARGSVLLTCSTAATQKWNTINGAIRAPGTGTCLDDGAGLNGSRVFLAPCNGSSHQRWNGLPGGGDVWVNTGSGRCLDADTGTIGQEGTKVQVWDCVGLANQIWSFEFVGD
jgi:hypothetical protein